MVVIAATNRLEDLDEAVVRRFESKIFIGPPDRASRALQVLAFLQGVHHSLTSADLDTIADLTFSWSGSDIEVQAPFDFFFLFFFFKDFAYLRVLSLFNYFSRSCVEKLVRYILRQLAAFSFECPFSVSHGSRSEPTVIPSLLSTK